MLQILEIAQIIIPTPPVPGQGLTLAEVGVLIARVSSFFTTIGAILALIAIVVSGIIYMRAGGSPEEVKKAQAWLKNALIGAFIVLGVNMIINTVANVVTRQFFCTLVVSFPPFINVCVP
ncbi:MAG: hypothetical protein HYS78_01045 [Parcubacteria group bacterium]|nr:hypothetical protein [Parcubacteria group bacterium]